MCRAGQLAEHEHATFIVAGADKLLGNEIHAITKASDITQIRRSIEPIDVGGWMMRIEEPNRLIRVRAEAAVHASAGFNELRASGPIFGQAVATWLRNLYENEAVSQFGLVSSNRSTARNFSLMPLV